MSSVPSKNDRREAARRRAEALRTETQHRERRVRLITIGSTVVGLAVLIVLVFVIVAQGSKDPLESADVQPANVADGAVKFGSLDNEQVELTVYSDYMCPVCNTFEELNAADMADLVETEGVVVSYFPLAFMDRSSNGGNFSTRSTSAAMCVADGAKDSFVDFHQAIFANQPAQGTTGLSNEEMAGFADQLGLSQEIQQCILDETYADYVGATASKASAEDGIRGTPTVLVNGKDLQDDLNVGWNNPGALKAAVLAEIN